MRTMTQNSGQTRTTTTAGILSAGRPKKRTRLLQDHRGVNSVFPANRVEIGTSVERVHASFTNSETRAYGRDGLPKQPLYLVGFAQRDVWPDYRGHGDDRIFVDVFEHWLERVE